MYYLKNQRGTKEMPLFLSGRKEGSVSSSCSRAVGFVGNRHLTKLWIMRGQAGEFAGIDNDGGLSMHYP